MIETVGLNIRKSMIARIQERIGKSSVYFFINFNKVDSSSLVKLRNKLRADESVIFVARNSLIRKALENYDLDELNDYLQGETGIVFVYNQDIVKPCKTLFAFSQENENFLIKGGVIESKKISKQDLEALAKLPSREVLLGQAVSSLASPLTGLLACLNQVILKFVWGLQEIKKVKDSQPAKKEDIDEKAQESQKVENNQKEEQGQGGNNKEDTTKLNPEKEESGRVENETKEEQSAAAGEREEAEKNKKED